VREECYRPFLTTATQGRAVTAPSGHGKAQGVRTDVPVPSARPKCAMAAATRARGRSGEPPENPQGACTCWEVASGDGGGGGALRRAAWGVGRRARGRALGKATVGVGGDEGGGVVVGGILTVTAIV
jgi:hypothetical protein